MTASGGRAQSLDREVKLALVLTGGVSLAVWMGGVAAEIQRLVRGCADYRRLLALTRTQVSVDVIGGSSAGGVNGAILAMGLSHSQDISVLRDTWVERASLAELLHEPSSGTAQSLLRGDAYFLPHLRSALACLDGAQLTDPVTNPMHLILTGTLLDGIRTSFTDDFGSSFSDSSHRAEFHFRRGANLPDDFAGPAIVDKLALAARATSSFPGAFEPTLCPVGADGTGLDLAPHVNFDTTRYVIDGGVLVNKPLAPVLGAVLEQEDTANVSRAIVYIQPAPDHEAEYGIEALPGMAQVIQAGFLGLPHAESLTRDLSQLQEHNRRVGANPVQLLHISAEAPNGLDDRRHPASKLAGLQMQHFGAFYRSSWRANDWMWGRLDGSTRLLQLLLAPARLHALTAADPQFPQHIYAVIRDIALGGKQPNSDRPWDSDGIREELRYLRGTRDELPNAFPACTRAVARGIHLDILRAELPYITDRIRADEGTGHRLPTHSRALLDAVPRSGVATDDEIADAFRACRLGEERIADDAGSSAYQHIVDRITLFGLRAHHHGSPRTTNDTGSDRGASTRGRSSRHRARVLLLTRPSPLLMLALRQASITGAWAARAVTVLLLAGAALVVSATSEPVGRFTAVAVGVLLMCAGAIVAGLTARRFRTAVCAAAINCVGCLALAAFGWWQWRAWLLTAIVADIAIPLLRRRAIRLRNGCARPPQ